MTTSTDLTVRLSTQREASLLAMRATGASLNVDVRNSLDATERPFEVKVHGTHDDLDLTTLYADLDHEVTHRLDNEELG